jgi:hypothetical protein
VVSIPGFKIVFRIKAIILCEMEFRIQKSGVRMGSGNPEN